MNNNWGKGKGETELEPVLKDICYLGKKLGVLLVQLPPRLEFQKRVVSRFLEEFRDNYGGPVAWEPRHATWNNDDALDLLASYRIARVVADPEPLHLTQNRDRSFECRVCVVHFRQHQFWLCDQECHLD